MLVHLVSTFVEIMVTGKWQPELAVSAEPGPKRKPLALHDLELISLHLKMNSGICCC